MGNPASVAGQYLALGNGFARVAIEKLPDADGDFWRTVRAYLAEVEREEMVPAVAPASVDR